MIISLYGSQCSSIINREINEVNFGLQKAWQISDYQRLIEEERSNEWESGIMLGSLTKKHPFVPLFIILLYLWT